MHIQAQMPQSKLRLYTQPQENVNVNDPELRQSAWKAQSTIAQCSPITMDIVRLLQH